MPLYEYQCSSCEKVHEVMQKFSDAPLAECPECNAPVKKLMSLGSFALKGSGWYATDYKRKSGGDSSGASSSAPSAQAPAAATPAAPAGAAAPAPAPAAKT